MGQQRKVSRELTELCARVQQWREQEGGGRGRRIPEELWQEAMRVSRTAGLHVTAQATRFNYERLKERVKAEGEDKVPGQVAGEKGRAELTQSSGSKGLWAKSAGSVRSEESAAVGSRFVALQVAPPGGGRQATVELLGRHGERMRVEVMGEVDVVGLVQTFWRRAS